MVSVIFYNPFVVLLAKCIAVYQRQGMEHCWLYICIEVKL